MDTGIVRHACAKGMTLSPFLTSYCKIHSKWLIDQNVTLKILEENT